MANSSLAATPLSHNDITALAQLFRRAFHYHRKHKGEFYDIRWQNFLKNLRTIVGLSYTVTLVQGDLLELYNSYLTTFLQNQSFTNSHSQHLKLAQSFTNMVSLGSDFFRSFGHPNYYSDFLVALRFCVIHIIEEINIKPPENAENVLKLILA